MIVGAHGQLLAIKHQQKMNLDLPNWEIIAIKH